MQLQEFSWTEGQLQQRIQVHVLVWLAVVNMTVITTFLTVKHDKPMLPAILLMNVMQGLVWAVTLL